MDALPLEDAKDVAYRSRIAGVCHACGHDVHTTIVVGLGLLIAAEHRSGRLTLIFQPAEETPFGERSGAAAMSEDGLFDGDLPEALLGLHCWPDLPVGTIGLDPDVAMAAKDAFRLRFTGSAAHAAMPSRGNDAVLAVSQAVVALHHLPSRNLSPGDLAVLNVGTINGGLSQIIIAPSAEVTGTLRTVDGAVRKRLKAAIEQVSAGIGLATGCSPSLEWANEMPAIRNDPRLVEIARGALANAPGIKVRAMAQPPMTADDFALLALGLPALYLKLGTCQNDGACPPLHSSTFDVDERAIGVGVNALHRIVTTIWNGTTSDGMKTAAQGLDSTVRG
jgi:amidohydrolase